MTETTLTPDPQTLRALHEVPAVDLARNLRLARANGQTYSTVLAELVKLQMGLGKLSVHEYFYYRLWDLRLSLDEKRQFLGRVQSHYLHAICNDEAFRAAADDKLLFHEAMTAGGFPVPELLAVAHARRRVDGVPALADAGSLRAFLSDTTVYPLFGKPINGVFSLGVFRADGFDAASRRLLLHDGGSSGIDASAEQIAGYSHGYLLQRPMLPATAIAERFGDRLWSVRLVVLLTPDGPVAARAACKIPTGGNIADNFWRRGNMLGAIDIASGAVARTVCGTGSDMQIDAPHPDAGVPITGFVLPDWEGVLEVGLRAAATLPAIRTQSWDIALTDRGPVLLEVNYGGDLNLVQLAWGKGMLDDSYRAHLASCGVKL